MEIDDETAKLLAVSAMLAGDYMMKEEARTIVSALERIKPEDEQVLLLKAVTEMKIGSASTAANMLRDEVLKRHPSSAAARSMLGLALHVEGRKSERDKVLQEAIDTGDDGTAVDFAQTLMQE